MLYCQLSCLNHGSVHTVCLTPRIKSSPQRTRPQTQGRAGLLIQPGNPHQPCGVRSAECILAHSTLGHKVTLNCCHVNTCFLCQHITIVIRLFHSSNILCSIVFPYVLLTTLTPASFLCERLLQKIAAQQAYRKKYGKQDNTRMSYNNGNMLTQKPDVNMTSNLR